MAQVPRACNTKNEAPDVRKAISNVMKLNSILLRMQAGVDPNNVGAPPYYEWAEMIDMEVFQKYLKGKETEIGS